MKKNHLGTLLTVGAITGAAAFAMHHTNKKKTHIK